MDLLEQYNKDHPEALREQKPLYATDPYGREYPAIVRMVMRLSGGRIKDARQANYALMVFAVLALFVSLFLFFGGGSGTFSPDWTPYAGS